MNDDQINQKLQQLLSHAYAPYSKVRVSAIVITKSGETYSGVNVENASYGATICAERSALVATITNAARPIAIKAIHVFSNVGKALYPCALCLQMMTEFCDKTSKIMIHGSKQVITTTINELLPHQITKTSF